MSRQRAQRLQPLIHLAQKSVNEALSYIGKIQQCIDRENEKKQSLIEYQNEYFQNFQTAGREGMKGLNLQQFESFLVQIDGALVHQKNQVFQYNQQLENAQKIYQKLNLKLKSYEKLQSRLDEQSIKQENQQMQKFLDEIGAQLHRLNSF